MQVILRWGTLGNESQKKNIKMKALGMDTCMTTYKSIL